MRTVLVTGGTGGLGPTVVKRLASEYRCVVLFHGQSGFAALQKTIDVYGVQADLSNESDVKRAMEQAGEAYALVHLAGGFDTDPNAWAKMLAVNFTTALNAFRNVQLANGGRIVAISSYATLTKPAGLGPYVVSKSALNSLVQTAAADMKNRHITANALLPDDLGSPAMRGRVAEVIAFLLSDAAKNITGALIPMVA